MNCQCQAIGITNGDRLDNHLPSTFAGTHGLTQSQLQKSSNFANTHYIAVSMDKGKRSYIMSQIRKTNTKPEIQVRKFLFREGFRYRLYNKKLPGNPDIVFAKI